MKFTFVRISHVKTNAAIRVNLVWPWITEVF